MSMPNNYELIASSPEINIAIQSIAEQIIDDFTDRSPLFVALLRGAVSFGPS